MSTVCEYKLSLTCLKTSVCTTVQIYRHAAQRACVGGVLACEDWSAVLPKSHDINQKTLNHLKRLRTNSSLVNIALILSVFGTALNNEPLPVYLSGSRTT